MRQMLSMNPMESEPPKKEVKRLSLEKTVRERIVFQDIDVSRPEQAYHEEMLRGLLAPGEEKQSLARRVLDRKGLNKKELERVTVESVAADDISKGIGYKRDVDRFTFAFSDGREVVFTVSLDKDAQDHADDSASLAESRALSLAKPLEREGEYSAIQEFYGTATLKDANGVRGLICKEYLPGKMLIDVMKTEGSDMARMDAVAREVGSSFAKSLVELNGAPVEMHAANIIIDETAGGLTARLCDVEYVRPDPEGVTLELRRLRKIFGTHASAFEIGFTETLKRLNGFAWMIYAADAA